MVVVQDDSSEEDDDGDCFVAVNNRATWVGFRNALSVPVCARFAVRFAVLTVGVIEKVPLMVAQVVAGGGIWVGSTAELVFRREE